MNFHILTLFPEMINQVLNTSIIGRAISNGHITVEAVNIRDYTASKHKKVDDYPYGGGAGMLMQAQPVYDAYLAIKNRIKTDSQIAQQISVKQVTSIEQLKPVPRVIYVTPQGKLFNQKMAKELANEENVILLCGHYEGIDERVLNEIVTDNISIGDYVLTGGELPAMVVVDAVARMVPGVLSNSESGKTESLSHFLLEYPQYSRPEVWQGKRVPEILLSGDHAKVEKWRNEQAIERTKERRPDLYAKWQNDCE
ncbi:MAG: tRNA (guanosine(37)-N1)-methyltransferase TrmD [Lachnospiraceae bacterium]|nr:tRNA (guanosine(37)-N1)-methyltransferase TrmD [Lachnospiraceae bacterium]